jgi:exonuclease III
VKLAALLAVVLAAVLPPPPVQGAVTVKIAFYNIRSGQGVPGLPGRPVSFSAGSNCRDRSKPLNAWGTGAVQKTLTSSLGDDPSIVALGLAEAWTATCASPESVRAALGWKAASASHNGVALVARYGFKGERWQQLDTSKNKSPGDTAWVLRADVCVDRSCQRQLPVYVAHWYGTGAQQQDIYANQARQTLAFMQSTSGRHPHVLIGDLNVWTARGPVCRQTPNGAAALDVLSNAHYVDAWQLLHATEDGSTGMLNRRGCGAPEGAAWKRIDYAWSPESFQPTAITRFGMVAPGNEAPSDHYGIIAVYPANALER